MSVPVPYTPIANISAQLIQKCESVLIRDHSEAMWEDFQKLLDFDKDDGE